MQIREYYSNKTQFDIWSSRSTSPGGACACWLCAAQRARWARWTERGGFCGLLEWSRRDTGHGMWAPHGSTWLSVMGFDGWWRWLKKTVETTIVLMWTQWHTMATYDWDEFSQECRSGIGGFAGFVGVPHKGYIREDISPKSWWRNSFPLAVRWVAFWEPRCLHPASRECGMDDGWPWHHGLSTSWSLQCDHRDDSSWCYMEVEARRAASSMCWRTLQI